jgi:hypothetical protein
MSGEDFLFSGQKEGAAKGFKRIGAPAMRD